MNSKVVLLKKRVFEHLLATLVVVKSQRIDFDRISHTV